MSDGVTLKVEGLRDLERALVELGNIAAPRILGKALKTPMEKVVADAKSLCAYDSTAPEPHLRDVISLTPVKRATSRRASMADTLSEVGIRLLKKSAPGKNPRRYWHLVEFAPGKSFLRAAMDRNTNVVLVDFKSTMAAEIDRTRARFARRGR